MPRAEERSGRRERRPVRRNPFVLVGESVRGLVVTAANSEARRGGVQQSMTLADARAVCPGLVSEPHDTARDADVLHELALWLGRYGPRRHTDGTDGLWVETTGVDHLFAGEEAMVRDLVSRCARVGLSARVGVAETYGAAHAMARYCCCSNAPVAIAATGDLEAALARVPVDGLRLTEDAAHLLKRLGLRRIGQLQAVSRIALARRFRDDGRGVRRSDREGLARAVVWRLDQAFGQDDEPKVSIEPDPLRMTRLAFADPLISAGGIESAAENLVTTLCQALEHQALGALATQLVLYRADGTRAAVDAVASRPSHTPCHWLSLLRERLSAVDAGLGIDAVTFAALSTGALPLEQSALVDGDRAEEVRRDGMAQLIDRLGNRVGSTRVLTHHPHESHIPERAERWLPAHARKRGTQNKRAGGGMRHVAAKMPFTLQYHDAHLSAGHRPSLILERPEP
ncbi:MAG: DNA polymerase Y family protein, partial [Pseudomonadota bacterium]